MKQLKKRGVRRLIPGFVKRYLNVRLEKSRLQNMKAPEGDVGNLRSLQSFALPQVFQHTSDEEWEQVSNDLRRFGLPDGSGGVNFGDRRAIYYLIRYLKPGSLLEVGTHIGASTVHIASALKRNKAEQGKDGRMISVDICDVNSEQTKQWLDYGSNHSPKEMVRMLDCEDLVKFYTSPSLDYLRNCKEKFDFIFLDGDHSATTVYKEVDASLPLLNEGGVILLHDYYPDMQPLWEGGDHIIGPVLGVKHLIQSGLKLKILPLGELPWPTKGGSNYTSLALVFK